MEEGGGALHACEGNKAAQTSASWLSGGLCQRQIVLQAAPELRPASANQPRGPRARAISAWLGLGLGLEPYCHVVHIAARL